MIEPIRPLVDLCVFKILQEENNICSLNKEVKIQLIKILQENMTINEAKQQIPNVIEIMVGSLRTKNIKLPLLT